MKKTLKITIAAILAFIVAFGSVTAFAADENGSLIWYNTEYTFAGTLAEGSNELEIPSVNNFYCTFDAEKAGFYTVEYEWREIAQFSPVAVGEGGVIEDKNTCVYLETDEEFEIDTCLFFFEEGENFLAGFVGNELTDGRITKVEITYCGEKISDIIFDGGTEYPLIPESDIYEYYDYEEEYEYPEPSYYLNGGETEIIFDSGKTLELLYHGFICTVEDELKIGENNITVYFFNDTFDKTVSVYPISSVITKVEVADFEKYLDVPVAYDGSLLYNFNGIEITVTYSDGYTETLVSERGEWIGVELRNGNPYHYHINYFYEYEEDKAYFCLTIGDEEFIREEVTSRDATKRENRQHLNYVVYEILSDAVWDIKFNFDRLERAETLWEATVYLRRALFDSADEIFTAFEEIIEEAAHCFKA